MKSLNILRLCSIFALCSQSLFAIDHQKNFSSPCQNYSEQTVCCQSSHFGKAREMSYVTQIIKNCKDSGMEEVDIEMFMKLIKETADQRELFMYQFYELYTPESIIQSLIQQSKEYGLYRWFLDHPREEFQDKPNDQQEYILTHVVDNELFVKKEYLMHMLEEIGVLNF